MSEKNLPRSQRLIGLLVAALSVVLIFLAWSEGITYFNGTSIEEFRFLAISLFSITFLSLVQTLLERFLK